MNVNIKSLPLKIKLVIASVLFLTLLACSTTVAYRYLSHIVAQPAEPLSLKPTATAPASTPATGTVAPQPLSTPTTSTYKPPASQPIANSLDTVIATINQRLKPYGVTATVSLGANASTYSTWSALDAGDFNTLQQFSSYLTDEFTKYPVDLVVNSGLKTIGLVKNLQVSGTARAAAPAPSITSMIYDVNSMTNAGSAYAKEVVSHEYWHYLDYRMRGSYTYDDTNWNMCNTAGFKYGSGGTSAYGSASYMNTFHPQAGLITQYATYALEEDRAEMFGWLIYSPQTVKGLGDAGINCKLNRLTAIVHQLSPSMGF